MLAGSVAAHAAVTIAQLAGERGGFDRAALACGLRQI
jgi:hypothetical protein